jgi:hypothetical protein
MKPRKMCRFIFVTNIALLLLWILLFKQIEPYPKRPVNKSFEDVHEFISSSEPFETAHYDVKVHNSRLWIVGILLFIVSSYLTSWTKEGRAIFFLAYFLIWVIFNMFALNFF